MLLFLNSYQVLGTLVDGCLNDEDNCKEIRSIIPKSSIRSFKLRFLANPEYNLVRNSQESFRHSLITYTFFPSKKIFGSIQRGVAEFTISAFGSSVYGIILSSCHSPPISWHSILH